MVTCCHSDPIKTPVRSDVKKLLQLLFSYSSGIKQTGDISTLE